MTEPENSPSNKTIVPRPMPSTEPFILPLNPYPGGNSRLEIFARSIQFLQIMNKYNMWDAFVDRCECQNNLLEYEFEDLISVDKPDDPCSICLNANNENDDWVKLKECSHVFHRECISTWIKKNDSCPLCRREVN